MKVVIGTLIIMSSLTLKANANIVCSGQSQVGPVKIEVAEDQIQVSGGLLSEPRIFTNLKHENGWTRAPSLAIKIDNHFGCMRNAVIITEFREPLDASNLEVIKVDLCYGGSTPDSSCERP
jgi:hypothetical protein